MKTMMIAGAGLVSAVAGLASMAPTTAEAQIQTRGAPRGSYAQSCTGAYVNQGRLYADCRDTSNRMRETSIELARCSSSDIGNDNGRLVCQGHRGDYEDGGRPGRPGQGGPGQGGPGWPGGPGNGGGWNSGTITVYRDSNFRGTSMTFREEIPNLRSSGLNDAITSLRLSRGGSWEVCEDANFRGRCRVISGDVRDLTSYGLNDRISSLRPARRGGW